MQLLGGMQEAGAAEANAGYASQVARNRALVADRNAALADADARTARRNAGRAGFAGQVEAMDQDLEARLQIGENISMQAGSGLEVGTGLTGMMKLAQRDRLRIRQAGDAEAGRFRAQERAFRVEAADLRSGAASARADAEMELFNGQSAAAAARLQGTAGLIGSIGSSAGIILDGSKSPAVRAGWDRIWKRKSG